MVSSILPIKSFVLFYFATFAKLNLLFYPCGRKSELIEAFGTIILPLREGQKPLGFGEGKKMLSGTKFIAV
jgi:hypothetical protein